MQSSALDEQERRLLALGTLESQSCTFIEHVNSTGCAITCTGLNAVTVVGQTLL